ncbi:hypothetical protein GCM10023116_21310 [Kistimonas scapharcae]|uniref:HTH merR-type domain-containing protein n=1 Tax=Kistimonas scapharcae TaxID=1036133 RepID=A0ABP8V461_9GAMM
MLTVTQLARKYDISRTTLLYYERVGLLRPRQRSENGYRWYGEGEIMQATNFSEEDMKNWHHQLAKMEPDAHQEFLESLKIDKDKIANIRAWSKQ